MMNRMMLPTTYLRVADETGLNLTMTDLAVEKIDHTSNTTLSHAIYNPY